jgi:hypothetical protein
MVLSTSSDGWTAGTPLSALTDGRNALIAIAMNGEPLPFEHGFPARLVVPGLYGYVSATKWLTELKVTSFAQDEGYWTPRGWSARGPVKTESRIDVPRSGDRVAAGRVAVAGIAWAQHRGIKSVEVRVDDGEWQPARLAEEPTIDSWRQWVLEWQAVKGNHTITVRATDAEGEAQTETQAPPAPDGATGGTRSRSTSAEPDGGSALAQLHPWWPGAQPVRRSTPPGSSARLSPFLRAHEQADHTNDQADDDKRTWILASAVKDGAEIRPPCHRTSPSPTEAR